MTVERTADRVAIDGLLARYADAVNTRRQERWRDVFTPDGVWDLGSMGVYRGIDAIVAGLTTQMQAFPELIHTIHQGLVRFDPRDASVAYGRRYFTEFGVSAAGEEGYFAGVYHDDYRRDADGGWRVAIRRYAGLFSRRGTTVAMRPFPSDIPAVWV